ncbi:alanine racemase [Bacillus sp. 1P10SD]|uniref:alanine racemase n=1 Tax=Bacillus sp. 1P10SD TaxID=3132265 RepID=UPI0039A6F52A
MHQYSYRDTWAEISLDLIQENMTQFRQFVQQQSKLMAVVKADGYGHGAIVVAKASILAGADYLGVALLDEAIQLRDAGISTPILILGYTPPSSVKEAILANITLTVFDHDVLDEVIVQSTQLCKTATVHLKVDTGMSRIGVSSPIEVMRLVKKALSAEYIYLEGIFTHFANADSEDPTYTYEQFSKFQSILEYLVSNNIHVPIKHCCNSAATMNYPDMHLDMVRIGIALYGLYPDKSLKNHPIRLRQAMSFKTRIAAIKNVVASQPISYGCTFKPDIESKIATLPVGYADGLSRLLSNKGKVLIGEHLAQITGRVCMDQTMINVSDVENCLVGDEVTIFGSNHSSFQSVDQFADWMGTINYEVVCLIGKRVPRVYFKHEQQINNANKGQEFLKIKKESSYIF